MFSVVGTSLVISRLINFLNVFFYLCFVSITYKGCERVTKIFVSKVFGVPQAKL